MPHLTTSIRANDSRTIAVAENIIYSAHSGTEKCALNTKKPTTISLIKQQTLSCNIYQESDGVIVYQTTPNPELPGGT